MRNDKKMKTTKSDLFKRQITLSEIGEEGQQKLQSAKVLVVGCGGLGSPIAVYLSASGIGELHLVDFDKVDVTNLHRQVFYSLEDVGQYKSEALSNFIQKRAPFTKVTFSTTAITKQNVLDLVNGYDVIVDGTDSLPTKYLVNDACVMQNKPLVYGSLYKFDGYVSTFNFGKNSANLRDAFPVMKTDVPNCEEAGTMNAIVGMIATAQVNEVLKIVAGIGKPLSNELLIYNALQNTQFKMRLQSKTYKEEVEAIFEKESYYDASCQVQNPDWLISSEELKSILSSRTESRNLKVISVLENLDTPFHVDEVVTIPNIDTLEIDESTSYVLICKRGITSYKALEIVKKNHPKVNVLSLEGGVSSMK